MVLLSSLYKNQQFSWKRTWSVRKQSNCLTKGRVKLDNVMNSLMINIILYGRLDLDDAKWGDATLLWKSNLKQTTQLSSLMLLILAGSVNLWINHGESVLVQQRRRPGSKNVEEGRKRDQREEREVKRELPQLRDGQDTVGMQRPMTCNIRNWQEWLFFIHFGGSSPSLPVQYMDLLTGDARILVQIWGKIYWICTLYTAERKDEFWVEQCTSPMIARFPLAKVNLKESGDVHYATWNILKRGSIWSSPIHP